MSVIGIQKCNRCGQSVNEREIGLFKEMVSTLLDVFKWCEERKTHEFSRKQVKHLFNSENVSARFGDWVFFGGLVYKNAKGQYGLNTARVKDFFAGKLEIPTKIAKNPLTDEIRKENYRFIHQIPNLKGFLDENDEFISTYVGRVEFNDNGQGEMF